MTENPTPVLLEDEFLDAARELRAITIERRDLDTREAECKAILAVRLAAGETGVDLSGTALVKVKAGARVWNEDTARKALVDHGLDTLIPQIEVTETHLDKIKAKQLLPGDLYDACCRQNKDSISAVTE